MQSLKNTQAETSRTARPVGCDSPCFQAAGWQTSHKLLSLPTRHQSAIPSTAHLRCGWCRCLYAYEPWSFEPPWGLQMMAWSSKCWRFKTCSCRISQWCHISLQISTYILDPAKALEMRIWLVVSSSVKFWAASSSLHGNITSKAPECVKSGKTKLSAADWCYRFKPFKRNSRVPITSKWMDFLDVLRFDLYSDLQALSLTKNLQKVLDRRPQNIQNALREQNVRLCPKCREHLAPPHANIACLGWHWWAARICGGSIASRHLWVFWC